MKRKLLALLTGALMAVSIMPAVVSAGTLIDDASFEAGEEEQLLLSNDEDDSVSWTNDEDYLGGELFKIWIGKDGSAIQVNSSNMNDVLQDGGSVKYDDTNRVLTLNNATIAASTTSPNSVGILSEETEGITICLKGENRIGAVVSDLENSTPDSFSVHDGIACWENALAGHYKRYNLNLTGDGNLTIYASGYGLTGDNITIGSDFTGKVTTRLGNENETCIQAQSDVDGDEHGNITIESGTFDLKILEGDGIHSIRTLKVTGGEFNIDAKTYGIASSEFSSAAQLNAIIAENAKFNIKVGEDSGHAHGFHAYEGIQLKNCDITIDSGEYGIWAQDLSIQGEKTKLDVRGKEEAYYFAVGAYNSLTIDDKIKLFASDKRVDFDKCTSPAQIKDWEEAKYICTAEGTEPAITVSTLSKSPSLTVPVIGDKSSEKVKAEVDGTQVKVEEVTKQILETVGTGANIAIDLTGLEKGINTIFVPKTTAENVYDSGATGLEVRYPNEAIATFDKDALAVVKQLDDEYYALRVQREDDSKKSLTEKQKATIKDIAGSYVVEVVLGTQAIVIPELQKGKVDVKIPYDKSAKVWFVDSDGAKSLVTSSYKDKMVSFEVKKFGHYVLEGSGNGYKECKQDENCVYAKFKDANPKAWYHSGVHFCVENGYMVGVSADKFKPNGTMTRSMIVTMLWRMEESPVVDYAISFKDVKEGQWYTDAIRWGQDSGVVKGYSSTKFGPDDKITREQLVTILKRYATLKGCDVSATDDLAKITDTDKISSWALDGVKWSKGAGIMSGRTKTTIDPDANATRAEAACMIQRLFENVLNK